MRVSDRMITSNMVYRINRASERLFRVQEQAASGLRFSLPSQDPAGAVRAASLRSSAAEVERYIRNTDIADSRLRLTEVSVAQIGDALRQARTVALSGINDGLDQTARMALAEEIGQISQEILLAGNAHDGTRYLFAGQKLLAPPLVTNAAPPPPISYQGDQGDLALQTGRRMTVVSNVNAAELLNLNGAADPALEDVFTTLGDLEGALRVGDHAAIDAAIRSLDAHFARVTGIRGEIGARLQRVQFDRSRLEETASMCTVLLGETEGADLTQVIADLKQEEVAYQAAAAAAALLGRASLLDYIR